MLAAGQPHDGRNGRWAGLAGNDFADEGVQGVFEIGEVTLQKIEGHFHGQKLVTFVAGAEGGQGGGSPAIKADAQGQVLSAGLSTGDLAVAGDIQADLNATGMKTPAPIQFRVGLEIVPFKADAGSLHAAVQMAPAIANGHPGGTLGKDDDIFFGESFGGGAHLLISVPAFLNRANFLSFGGPMATKTWDN